MHALYRLIVLNVCHVVNDLRNHYCECNKHHQVILEGYNFSKINDVAKMAAVMKVPCLKRDKGVDLADCGFAFTQACKCFSLTGKSDCNSSFSSI